MDLDEEIPQGFGGYQWSWQTSQSRRAEYLPCLLSFLQVKTTAELSPRVCVNFQSRTRGKETGEEAV